MGDHYNGCNSLPGFLGTNHFCHPCKGRKYPACHKTGCPDFSPDQSPCHHYRRCHRTFFGEQCLGNHYVYSTTDGKKADCTKKIKNVCASEHKCLNCNRLLRPRKIETRHVCGTAECPSCKQYHNLYSHQRHIQTPTKLEQKRQLLKSRKRKADGSQSSQTKENLFGYWDSETIQDTDVYVPNLVCAATSNCDDLFHFEGTTCIRDFIDWLRELALDFKLTVLAHNSQELDSYLILDELY